MLLTENKNDLELLNNYIDLCINEKMKMVVIIGGTTLAFHSPKNWIAKYVFENIDYKQMIIKPCDDRIKVYFNSKKSEGGENNGN